MRTLRPFHTLIVLALALMWIAAASIAQAMPRPSTTAGDPPMPAPKAEPPVRETLPNGMKVVIVRNTLAPVVTVETNYLVGGNETPEDFPGMAHAQEHMAFRGCNGMTADQAAAIFALLGGDIDADTQQNITQYFNTVPAADADIALHAQAACMSGIEDSQAEWDQERGAIEQEVARDLSNPTYKFIDRMNKDMFAGTPYAHDSLGTRPSFEKTTGAMLKEFHDKWYTPSNAILVVVGDVDSAATMAEIEKLYADVPSHPLPALPAIQLQPMKSDTFTLESNLPYVLGFIAWRMPGTDSPDWAAMNVLADVLASQRADLYAMVPAGKALAAEFGLAEAYRQASVAYGLVAQPAGQDVTPALDEMRQIVNKYAETGVPADLVDAAKRQEIAQAAFQRNSISGLADVWSNALAAEGRNSPEEDIEAIRKVTVADVNRVAKQYLLNAPTITATLKPAPNGAPVSAKGFGGAEAVTKAPTKPVELPVWAASRLNQLQVPHDFIQVSDTKLPNGIRLIVRTDHTSPTVTVVGGGETQFRSADAKGRRRPRRRA